MTYSHECNNKIIRFISPLKHMHEILDYAFCCQKLRSMDFLNVQKLADTQSRKNMDMELDMIMHESSATFFLLVSDLSPIKCD